MDKQIITEDKTLRKVLRWYNAAVDYERQGWRDKCRMWHDYYHGDQLSEEVLRQMRARSQPPVNLNLIRAVVGLIAGQEVQGRTDVQFLGFEDSDAQLAEILTSIYRQMGEAEYFDQEMSSAFMDGAIGGRGVVEVYWDEENKKLCREYVDWQEIFVDPASKRPDLWDARHIFRVRWLDEDEAIDLYPDSEDKIKKLMSKNSEDEFSIDYINEVSGQGIDDEDSKFFIDIKRKRLKVIEAHWKDSSAKNGILTGTFCDDEWLSEPEDSPYKHGHFPYVFTFCSRDTKRKPYGVVKDLVDPQDTVNKMFSKGLHILGTKQVIAEEGAITNMQNIQDNIAKADAIITGFAPGAVRDGRVIINDNRQDADTAFKNFHTGVTMIQQISGVNPEMQGMSTNARSGVAISMRKRQGNTVIAGLYDSLSKSKKRIAEISLSLMAQYMTDRTIARYKLPNGQLQSVILNGVDEIGYDDAGNIIKAHVNNIKEIFKFDVVISESANSANADGHELTQLVELLKAVPQVATPAVIAQLVQATNLPGKEALAKAFLPQQPSGDGQPTPMQ